jgi:hypothetical protein
VSIPDTVTFATRFMYGDGTKLAALALKRGGWNAVDQLLRDPPQSSHQVLNPEAYLDHHVPPPLKISLHGYETLMAGWRKVDEDTLGQVGLLGMIHQNLGDAENWKPLCNAWTGDRYLTLSKDDDLAIIGFVVFDNQAAAAHFASTYAHILDLADAQRIPHAVEARGNTALYLIGESATRASTISNPLWTKTDFGAKAAVASAKARAN